MALATFWNRAVVTDTTGGIFNAYRMVNVAVGSTLLRAYWSFHAHGAANDSGTFPPGAGITRVGLLWALESADLATLPSPISQPDDNWIDIQSFYWSPLIDITSTQVTWVWYGTLGMPDLSTKAMRKVPGSDPYSVYMVWETSDAADTTSGFSIRVAGSVDCLIGH